MQWKTKQNRELWQACGINTKCIWVLVFSMSSREGLCQGLFRWHEMHKWRALSRANVNGMRRRHGSAWWDNSPPPTITPSFFILSSARPLCTWLTYSTNLHINYINYLHLAGRGALSDGIWQDVIIGQWGWRFPVCWRCFRTVWKCKKLTRNQRSYIVHYNPA